MSANYSEIQICNKALLRLSANQVESTNGTVATLITDSLESKLCALNFDLVRDIVLEDKVWSFALRRAQLDFDDPIKPAFGFANRFAIPLDALNIWRVANSTGQVNWILEDGYILTNEASIQVQYIKRLNADEIKQASPQFVDSLSLRLAIEFCMPLTENSGLLESLKNEYEYRLQNASAIDGSQATHETFRSTNLTGHR